MGATLLLCGLDAAAAHAQSIRGIVTDSVTGTPLATVRVTLISEQDAPIAVTTTDSAGAFVLVSGRAGNVRLKLQRLGYVELITATIVVGAAENVRIDLRLSAAPLSLDSMAVTATMQNWNLSQFMDRQRTGWGRYVGPQQLAALPARTAIQAVMRIGGGRVLADDRGNGLLMRNAAGAHCVPRVAIDGSLQPPPDQSRKLPGNRRPVGFNADALIAASAIRAVEVYLRPSDAPVEYQRFLDTDCGIVLFWTDRGLGIR